MKTFATLATAGSYASAAPGEILVGRKVANSAFARALLRHGPFEQYCFFVGESSERAAVEELTSGAIEPGRVRVENLLELPGCIERGELDVLHHNSHLDRFLDLVWLRDRHARGALPVTAQIHSLSYARATNDYLRALLIPPSAGDAIFCSSDVGRRALEESIAGVSAALERRGAPALELACELPVVPLGVDVDALAGGDRSLARERLGIPQEAFCVLGLARFTEYDKMDLFPLLQAFRGLAEREGGPPPVLLLAGARQGTQTPEMLGLWAKLLGVSARMVLRIDFAEAEKRELLAAADVFVSPCDNPQETFGITVVEAMAAGLPSVVSDFDGYRETAIDGVALRVSTRFGAELGALSDIAPLLHERPLHLFLGQGVEVDLIELERGLVKLWRDEALRRDMGARASARARSEYDWPVVIQRYAEVWRRLRAEDRNAPGRAADSGTRTDSARGRHPLTLDYARVFGHYATERVDLSQRVGVSDLGRWLAESGVAHPIYPELKNVFSPEQVARALELCAEPLRLDALAEALAEPEQPRWHSRLLVAWLLKHGLVARTSD